MDKVKLSGFKLDEIEMQIVDKVIKNHLNKIGERMRFDEIRIDLKKKQHGKAFLHEVKGSLRAGKRLFNSEVTDYNLLKAISSLLTKLENEAEHARKK